MKTTVVLAAMLCGVAATSSAALGQQYAPPAARPTARYAPPAARMAQRTPASYAGAQVRQPAMVASAPVPSFRPINPPSQSMQRTLVASRTPTPAPPQARTASNSRTTAQPLPAYQPTQGWAAPNGSMSYDGGGNESSGYDAGSDYSYGDGGGDCGGDCCGGGHGCGHGCGHCCGQCLRHGILIPHCSTGDMVQHMPFFGTTHGYYYFRPYHVMHVYSQQELATRWGDDPRNPYDNALFQRIYEQMGIEARPVTPTPTVVPSGTSEYTVPGATYTPTPVPYGAMPSIPTSPGTMPSNTLPMPGIERIPSPTR